MEKEIWKDIRGFENKYQISNMGRIRSIFRYKIILKPALTQGYKFVSLYNKTSKKCYRIHRLVAQTFIPNPNNKITVNHKNGIKTDNRVSNLEWNTYQENIKHSYNVLGRNPTKYWSGKFGKDNSCSKIVLQYTLDKNFVKRFTSVMEASIETNICKSSIARNARGERKTAGGYIWVYSPIGYLKSEEDCNKLIEDNREDLELIFK